MKIRAFGRSDVGLKRDANEDAMLMDGKLGLYVVCDGMGGHAAGEVAANLAIRTIRKSVAGSRDTVDRVRKGMASHHELQQVSVRAIDEGCRAVYEAATSNPEHAGMGCTVTVLLVAGSKAAVAHVGDTALYLCRDEETERLTLSHTYAAELTRLGAMTRTDAEGGRYAYTLTRAVGTHAAVESDKLVLDVLPGDTFLLCSDGLTMYLEGENELTFYLSGDDVVGVPSEPPRAKHSYPPELRTRPLCRGKSPSQLDLRLSQRWGGVDGPAAPELLTRIGYHRFRS